MGRKKGFFMKQYVVDAFTDKIFCGNPAAICVMNKWLPNSLLSAIARENNLSETAFAVKENGCYHLRWFTPGGEIDLCGHATLATAYIIMRFHQPEAEMLSFQTLSGTLTVEKKDDLYEMDFPAYKLKQIDVTEKMTEAIGAAPIEAYIGRDLLCIFDSEQTVKALKPDMNKLVSLDGLLLQATAASREFDCVSRSFAPKLDVPEDPVCGSGHCHIIPFWAERLGKEELVAYQASERSGILYCKYKNGRVKIAGKAVLYSVAETYVG